MMYVKKKYLFTPHVLQHNLSHLGGVGVRAELLGTGRAGDGDEASVKLDPLLGTSRGELLLLLSLHLGGLVLHLTGASERSVDLASSSESKDQMEGRLLLDIVVAMVEKERKSNTVEER
jgi:hypothetical protein